MSLCPGPSCQAAAFSLSPSSPLPRRWPAAAHLVPPRHSSFLRWQSVSRSSIRRHFTVFAWPVCALPYLEHSCLPTQHIILSIPRIKSLPWTESKAARRPSVHSRPSDRCAAATLSPLLANEPVHYYSVQPHLPFAIHCRPRPHPPSTTSPTYALIALRAVAIALAFRLPASGPTSIRFHTASASASILQSIHLLRASAKPPPLAQSPSP